MAELVADCPRCGAARITTDVKSSNYVGPQYKWKLYFEVFAVCRHCSKSTIFRLALKNIQAADVIKTDTDVASMRSALNDLFDITGYVSLKDRAAIDAPKYLPSDIQATFDEAAMCLAVQCWNASAAMLRLCIDLATKPMLPEEDVAGLNRRTRRDLGLRLPWLFDNGFLPNDLRDLAKCIREDGNDGAHDGSLQKADAEDLLDFTKVLLDRVFTEKERLRLAQERRDQRRPPKDSLPEQ